MMTARLVEWGTAGRPLGGEAESGDRAVALEHEHGTLLAVIDGLGHGPEASDAAEAAVEVLRDAPERPIEWLVRDCHQALRHTRGVVMALVSLQTERSLWLSVGNVEGKVIRPGLEPLSPLTLAQFGGIVGYQLPPLHASQLTLAVDDIIVLASDGLRADFKPDIRQGRPVQEIADGLLEAFGKANDDAVVLVARYLGEDS